MAKVILFISLITGSLFASDMDRLKLLSADEKSSVWALSGSVSDHDLDLIWKKIAAHLHKGSAAEEFYLTKTWNILRSKKSIRQLTSSLRSKLAIPEKYCAQENDCYDLVALYLPMSNTILIDYAAFNEEVVWRTYHELIHAFQYMFRYPLDVGQVFGFTQSEENPRLEINELNDFLKFYYETQANWYTLKFSRDREWFATGSSTAYLVAMGAAKSLLNGLSVSALSWSGLASEREWLPKEYWRRSHVLLATSINLDRLAQLELPELLVVKDLNHMFSVSQNLDFDFHLRYTSAIEKAYFGDADFLKRRNNGDQKLFVKIHDNVYDKLKTDFKRKVVDNQKCSDAISSVIRSDFPLVTWYTIEASTFESCQPYADTKFWLARDFLLTLFLDFPNERFFSGTKGAGGPALKISPSLHFHPQLIIKPTNGDQ